MFFDLVVIKYLFREKLYDVPTKVRNHLAKKEYLHATKLLVEAVTLGKNELEGVEGIKELSRELEHKKEVSLIV